MPFAPVDGVDLHYEIDGDTGPWVVFAHGGEGTHLHWWQQAAALRSQHRCVTYDARGFGLSGREPSSRGTDAHSHDLLGLLDHLGIDQAFLVGQSMGGWAVSRAAQQHPERVAGLVMGDTPFGFATEALSTWAAEMLEKIPAGFDVLDHLYGPRFADEEPEMWFLYQSLNRLNPPRTGPRGLDAYMQMRDQPVEDYSDFRVPTLFILGEEDELTLPWMIRATAASVGGATLTEVPGAGHSAFCERPQEYNRIVMSFIEEHPTGSTR